MALKQVGYQCQALLYVILASYMIRYVYQSLMGDIPVLMVVLPPYFPKMCVARIFSVALNNGCEQ